MFSAIPVNSANWWAAYLFILLNRNVVAEVIFFEDKSHINFLELKDKEFNLLEII